MRRFFVPLNRAIDFAIEVTTFLWILSVEFSLLNFAASSSISTGRGRMRIRLIGWLQGQKDVFSFLIGCFASRKSSGRHVCMKKRRRLDVVSFAGSWIKYNIMYHTDKTAVCMWLQDEVQCPSQFIPQQSPHYTTVALLQ